MINSAKNKLGFANKEKASESVNKDKEKTEAAAKKVADEKVAKEKADKEAQVKKKEEEAKEKEEESVVEMTEEEKLRNRLNAVFLKFDSDGGGTLDEDEFGILLKELHVFMNENQVSATFRSIDEDGEGSIDFEEFFEWYKQESDKKGSVTGALFLGISIISHTIEIWIYCGEITKVVS